MLEAFAKTMRLDPRPKVMSIACSNTGECGDGYRITLFWIFTPRLPYEHTEQKSFLVMESKTFLYWSGW